MNSYQHEPLRINFFFFFFLLGRIVPSCSSMIGSLSIFKWSKKLRDIFLQYTYTFVQHYFSEFWKFTFVKLKNCLSFVNLQKPGRVISLPRLTVPTSLPYICVQKFWEFFNCRNLLTRFDRLVG